MSDWQGRSPGSGGVRATEFIPVGDDRLVVGVHWIAGDGSPAEPLVFHRVDVRDGRIAHIQAFAERHRALGRRRA